MYTRNDCNYRIGQTVKAIILINHLGCNHWFHHHWFTIHLVETGDDQTDDDLLGISLTFLSVQFRSFELFLSVCIMSSLSDLVRVLERLATWNGYVVHALLWRRARVLPLRWVGTLLFEWIASIRMVLTRIARAGRGRVLVDSKWLHIEIPLAFR